MADRAIHPLQEIITKYIADNKIGEKTISRSFNLTALPSYAIPLPNDKSVVSFILSITLTGYSSAELVERMVAATVNFTNKTIQFEDLPKNLFGFDQKTTQMSILRALYFMIPSEQGTYHDSPLLKNKKSPISQGLHIPLTESYQIDELTMDLVCTRKRSDTISYKKIDIDNGKVKTTVHDSIQLQQQDFEVDIPAHFITATCTCTECKSYEEWSPCRHIEVALTSIKETLPELFFNPDYGRDQLIADLQAKLPEEDPLRTEGQLAYDQDGHYMLMQPDDLCISDPADTLKALGLNFKSTASKADPELSRKLAQNRFQLFFYISPISYRFNSNINRCWLPLPARGKLAASGKLNLNFVTLHNIEKLTLQLSNLTDEEALHATSYLQLSNTIDERSWEYKPSVESVATIHQLRGILKQHPLYLYIDKFDIQKFEQKGLERLTQLELHDELAEVRLDLIQTDFNQQLIKLRTTLHAGDQEIEINPDTMMIHQAFVIVDYKEVYIFRSAGDYQMLNYHLQVLNREKPMILYQPKDLPKLYDTVIKPLGKLFEINSEVHNKQQLQAEQATAQLFLTDTDEGTIRLTPAIQYGEDSIPLTDRAPLYDRETNTLLERDADFENQYLEYLRSLHPSFDDAAIEFTLTGEQLMEDNWLLNSSEKLRNKGVQIYGSESLKNFRYNLHTPTISISTSSGIDWFDLKINIKFGKQTASLQEVRKSVMNKSQYIQLSDGTVGILPEEWLERYARYFQVGRLRKDKLEISNYQFNIIDQLYDDLPKRPKYIEEMMERRRRLQNLTKLTPHPIPKGINAELRSYQQSGFDWLLFLNQNQLGGCLADDMGLGKTLQVITLLQHLKEQSGKKPLPPHLIVLPTSLLFNWQKELDKFAPSLTYLVYRGGDRASLRELFSQYDIILSTYGVVSNDIEELSQITFEYAILDESQAIKNPLSKRYKAVRLLQANHRLALTGTPIENNTFDLYAQMNFLNPGIFGSMDHFRQNFANAIDKQRDERSTHLLRDMTQPFLLRRTKKQVATELPDKTETVLYCEMKEEQRKVYDSHKEHFREQLLCEMENSSEGEAQMMVLQALTKLRQICNSPALISTESEDYGTQSIKLDILMRNLREIESEHKALVFSQFTSMLALVKKRLELEGIPYVYLDGSTTNREAVVQQFQEDDEIRVFLISLKAGGTGLNLTAADYVFLIDPWWNPAVENQAIDRSYRIGQEKHVNAYRLVCKETIEEKILQLQESKRSLSEDIIQTDKIQKSFSRDDIADLFK